MEPVDHIAVPDSQADIYNLLLAEVAFQITVSEVINRFQSR